MAVLLHAVSLAGVCRKERISPVPQVRARPEEMRCVGSKRTRELGRDMLLAASIVESSGRAGAAPEAGTRAARPAPEAGTRGAGVAPGAGTRGAGAAPEVPAPY